MADASKVAASLNGKKILVVENEAVIAMKIEMMIVDAGGEVVGPCATFKSAEKAAEVNDFDAAIFDVRLGHQEVYPIARKVSDRGIKFMFYSAHAQKAVINELFPGAQLINKPAPQSDIINGLVRCVN